MQRLPAISGLQWIRSGFALLRRQPNQLSLLFLLYVTVNLVLLVVPLVGSLLLLILNQLFTTAFMLGCAEVDAGRQARPRLLFAYLKKPALAKLAGLGLCYVAASLLAGGAMVWYSGGTLIDTMIKMNDGATGAAGAVDKATKEAVLRALFFGTSFYRILTLPLWFAAPLIAWQNMGVAKAIFFSVFSVLRAIKAFIAYILAWAAISLFMSINLTALLSLLPGVSDVLALAVTIPCMLFLWMVGYCSFYPSYVELFGKPQLTAEDGLKD